MMIRLLLVLSAAASCLAGIGASHILSSLLPMLRAKATWDGTRQMFSIGGNYFVSRIVCIVGAGVMFFWSYQYVTHCTMMSAIAYSSPSIVMASNRPDGTRVIQDDFREAYY